MITINNDVLSCSGTAVAVSVYLSLLGSIWPDRVHISYKSIAYNIREGKLTQRDIAAVKQSFTELSDKGLIKIEQDLKTGAYINKEDISGEKTGFILLHEEDISKLIQRPKLLKAFCAIMKCMNWNVPVWKDGKEKSGVIARVTFPFLCSLCDCSEKTMRKYINELQEEKLIYVRRLWTTERNNPQRLPNVYSRFADREYADIYISTLKNAASNPLPSALNS